MFKAKDIAVISVYVALLIGGQFALSFVAGIEIVTVLLVSFCYYFGVKKGLITATAFSLLRCFIFGFFPNVIILYLIYYNLLAVVFGLLGKRQGKELKIVRIIIVVVCAVLCTASFTMLDNVLTPLMYKYTLNAAKAYFMASLIPMGLQCLCTFLTVGIAFPLLYKAFDAFYTRL